MMSLLGMAQMAQLKKAQTETVPAPTSEVKEEFKTMTDEEIINLLKTFPKSQLNMAKMMPEGILKDMILDKVPITEEAAERAIKILKTKF